MKKILLVFNLFLAAIVFAQKPNAIVMAVHDGDSYKVQFQDSARTTVWVRLWGADCPEIRSNHVSVSQPFGVEIGDTMRVFLKKQRVYVDTLYRDLYNRPVAKIKYNGQDITEYIIGRGYAWYYSSANMSTKNRNKLKQLQLKAQTEKVGLWAGENPINPSVFRRGHKTGK